MILGFRLFLLFFASQKTFEINQQTYSAILVSMRLYFNVSRLGSATSYVSFKYYDRVYESMHSIFSAHKL